MDITEKADTTLERNAAPAPSSGDAGPLRLLSMAEDDARDEADITRQECSADPHTRIFALYEEYQPRLFNYLRSFHLRGEEAEELIQETFTLLTDALLKQTEINNVQGWIVRVAHHLAVDAIKRRTRETNRMQQLSDYEFASVRDRSASPEDDVLRLEQARQIEAALERFTLVQRQCFYMRAEGFRNKDIALALGISPQRVATVIRKVLVRLAAICG